MLLVQYYQEQLQVMLYLDHVLLVVWMLVH